MTLQSDTQSIKVRLDKYLWAIRIFKTRSISAEYCVKGKVKCDERILKASSTLQKGKILQIEISKELIKKIEIIELLEKRVSAAEAKKYFNDLTIYPEKQKKEESVFFKSDKYRKGNERPGKKLGRAWRKQFDS